MNKELEKYKNLLESYLKELDSEMCCPFGMDPNTEGKLWRKAKQEAIVWCLEMLPEIKGE